MFVDILTADGKYSLLRDNLRQPIQMQLSQKKKLFSEFFFFFCFFFAFLKARLNFQHFQKNNDRHS